MIGHIDEIHLEDKRCTVYMNGKRFVFYGESNRARYLKEGQYVYIYKENGFFNVMHPGEYKMLTAKDGSCKKVLWFTQCKRVHKKKFSAWVRTFKSLVPICAYNTIGLKEGEYFLMVVKDSPKKITTLNNRYIYYCIPERIIK